MSARTVGAAVGAILFTATAGTLALLADSLRAEDPAAWVLTLAFAVGFGLLLGTAAGLTVGYLVAASRGRGGSERMLALATAGLPARRAEWGEAMRAELAALDDPGERRRFSRGAAAAAMRQGLGIRLLIASAAALAIGGIVLAASRMQLGDGGPGVLGITVPVPALVLAAVSLAVAFATRSFRAGLESGLLAAALGFAALALALTIEGMVWMQLRGVFVLDGEPPRHPADAWTIALDLFTTGMWIGHVLFWFPVVVVAAAVGTALSRRRSPTPTPTPTPAPTP